MVRENWQKEFIQGSAIDPELFGSSIRLVEDDGRWGINEILNHHVSRFWQSRQPHNFGSAAVFVNNDGDCWQVKPENPRIFDGKTIKYEFPKGQKISAYLPTIPNGIAQRILGVNGDEFWGKIKSNKKIPIILTEGGKKALSLLSQGFPAVALCGVNGGLSKFDKINGAKIRKIHPEFVDGLKDLVCQDRTFYLCFDEDQDKKKRFNVDRAKADLAFWLERSGCSPRFLSWDPALGKGIDDFIVNGGSVHALIAESQSYSMFQAKKDIENRLSRIPNRHIGDREFWDFAKEYPKSGIIAFCGGKGTGKGKAIAGILNETDQNWLSITTLKSLARDQEQGWQGAFLNDCDRWGGHFIKNGEKVRGAIICVPSILKAENHHAEILILDELPTIREFLLESSLSNKDGKRGILIQEFERRVQSAKLIILASADLSDYDLQWIERIRNNGDRAYLVRSDRKPLGYPVRIFEGSKNQAIGEFFEHIESIPDNKIIIFNSDSRQFCESISEDLNNLGIKNLLITSQTSGGEIESSFLGSKGHDIPLLINMGIKIIIASPSIKEGFSVENNSEMIDSVWGIFNGGSIGAESISQTCDRVRSEKVSRNLWIAKKGKSKNKISQAESKREFIDQFIKSRSCLSRVLWDQLGEDSRKSIEEFEWNNPHVDVLASSGSYQNRSKRRLRDSVIALLQNEGKNVEIVPSNIDKSKSDEISQRLSDIRKKLDQQWAESVERAEDIDLEQAEKLRKEESISPDDALKLHKFYLKQFYRDDIKSNLILWDNKGQKRAQIRRIEFLLNPELSLKKSLDSIEGSESCPQDWDLSEIQRIFLEKSGSIDLIKDIWEEKIKELDPNRIKPIARFIRKYSKDFQQAFNFSVNPKISDNQLVFVILDWLGFSRESHRHRNKKGKAIRKYYINQENLKALRDIVFRRQSTIQPSEKIKDNGIGGSRSEPIPISIGDKVRIDKSLCIWVVSSISGDKIKLIHPMGIGHPRFADRSELVSA